MAQGVRGPPVAQNDNDAAAADDDMYQRPRRRYRPPLMANLRPADTGLPVGVWLLEGGDAAHDVLVRVRDAFVAVRPIPHVVKGRLLPGDFEPVARWIGLNKDVIVDYWNGDIGKFELMQRLLPLA